MGLEGLPYQLIQVPFSRGLSTKDDARASEPPALAICRDAQFDTLGALSTRYPFLAIGINILGGGTLSNVRRLAVVGGELVCFTIDSLYSWSVRDAKWVLRGTHLAVKVDEATRFATSDDQINADRAELGGVVFYTWSNGTAIFVASADKSTGAVLSAPQQASAAGTRPRLVAGATRVFLFYATASDVTLNVRMLDPANAGTGLLSGPTSAISVTLVSYNLFYDVAPAVSGDVVFGAWRCTVTTTYAAFSVTWNGAAIVVAGLGIGRTCDGPIAVSPTPDGTHIQIIRSNAAAIVGDLLTLVFADVFINQALGSATVGTPINQIAACHRLVQVSSHWRCQVFWSAKEDTTNASGFSVETNWVDDANNIGSKTAFVGWCGLGSRAFAFGSFVFVWLAFGQTSGLGSGAANTSSSGQFQNAYFLYRDDGFLAAKSVYERGGGLAPSTGRLPGVQLTSGSTGFSWCAAIRRIAELGPGTGDGAEIPSSGYAERAPQEVTFTFDSDEARRSAVSGATLYLGAGEILQYDGVGLYEVGFHVYPWFFDAVIGGGTHIANGLYAYKGTFDWPNARGEMDRSTTATVANATMAGGPNGFSVQSIGDPITHKTTTPPAIRVWRTKVNPNADDPFYLVTSLDPTHTSNPNRYLANIVTGGFPSSVTDDESDATAARNETNPENEGILEGLSPPAAGIVIATDTRVFLGAVAGDPDRIWYSKLRNAGEVAAFNDALVIPVDPLGGDITALAVHRETLFAFRETAIYQLDGNGSDNAGGGVNYGPPRSLSRDVGAVSQEAVAVTPMGIVHKSRKGWYLTELGATPRYIGKDVAEFDGDTIQAVTVVGSQHQVRVLTDQRMLVWDYFTDSWDEWTIANGLDAVIWNGAHVVLTTAGPLMQASDFSSGVDYGLDVETAWIKPGGLQGRGYVRMIQIIGEVRSSHALRVRVAYDYIEDGSGNPVYVDDVIWPATPVVVGSVEQLRHGPSKKRCQAIKVRITAVAAGATLPSPTPPSGEAARLTGIALDAAPEPGLYSGLALAQRD